MLNIAVGCGRRRCNSKLAIETLRSSSTINCSSGHHHQRSAYLSKRSLSTSTSHFSSLPAKTSPPSSSSIIESQTRISSLTSLEEGCHVSIGGWIVSIRRVSKTLAFAVLLLPRGQGRLQLIARSDEKGAENSNVEAWQHAGIHGAVFVKGKLHTRPKEGQLQSNENTNPLSQLELQVDSTQILNRVPTGSIPFDPLDTFTTTKEEVRMKHRYLDLRSDKLGHNIRLRSKVSWAIRNYLHELDFTEVETPILLRSTPEGAREYLVPTRVNKQFPMPSSSAIPPSSSATEPQFFALQQSPQQPKQLLIASGVTDRYFQIAKCFRDEDGRKDRQAEFTQIDLEMGFLSGTKVRGGKEGAVPGSGEEDTIEDWKIGGQEIRRIIEGMVQRIWKAAGKIEEANAFNEMGFGVLKYDEAMKRFGSDKPDLRYGLEIVEVGDAIKDLMEEEVVEEEDGWEEKKEVELLCFTPPNGSLSNAEMDELFRSNKEVLEGVERFKVPADSANVAAKLLLRKSSNLKSLLQYKGVLGEDVDVSTLVLKMEEAQSKGSLQLQNIESGDTTYLFTAQKILPSSSGSTRLGDLRRLLVDSLVLKGRLQLPTHPHFTWVTEFPLFTLNDSDKVELSRGRWSSTHHPFTSPMDQDIPLVKEALSDDSSLSKSQKRKIMHTCKGQHYDLVLNGVEIGGGSVRIHDAELQRLILEKALELTPSEVNRFGHLLQALSCGAPPHGGIAIGFDRLMSILCNTSTIRDVIAFPKSATSRDLLFECPDRLDSGMSLQAYGLKPINQ